MRASEMFMKIDLSVPIRLPLRSNGHLHRVEIQHTWRTLGRSRANAVGSLLSRDSARFMPRIWGKTFLRRERASEAPKFRRTRAGSRRTGVEIALSFAICADNDALRLAEQIGEIACYMSLSARRRHNFCPQRGDFSKICSIFRNAPARSANHAFS